MELLIATVLLIAFCFVVAQVLAMVVLIFFESQVFAAFDWLTHKIESLVKTT